MKKQKKVFFIIAAVVAVAVIAFILVRNRKKTTVETSDIITPSAGAGQSGSPLQAAKDQPAGLWPLRSGSSNIWVSALQKHLNTKYKAGLVVDGNYGPKTVKAVKFYLGKDSISNAEFNKLFGK